MTSPITGTEICALAVRCQWDVSPAFTTMMQSEASRKGSRIDSSRALVPCSSHHHDLRIPIPVQSHEKPGTSLLAVEKPVDSEIVEHTAVGEHQPVRKRMDGDELLVCDRLREILD